MSGVESGTIRVSAVRSTLGSVSLVCVPGSCSRGTLKAMSLSEVCGAVTQLLVQAEGIASLSDRNWVCLKDTETVEIVRGACPVTLANIQAHRTAGQQTNKDGANPLRVTWLFAACYCEGGQSCPTSTFSLRVMAGLSWLVTR